MRNREESPSNVGLFSFLRKNDPETATFEARPGLTGKLSGNHESLPTAKIFKQPPVTDPKEVSRVMRLSRLAPYQGRKTVETKSLIPTQSSVDRRKVAEMATAPINLEDDVATVYKEEGRHYLVDGHHRTASAITRGKKRVTAHLYEAR